MSQAHVPPPEKYFLTPKEASRIIGVGMTFMYELLRGNREGENPPPFRRFGRHYRIPSAEFMQWINQQPSEKKKCT